MDDILKVFRNPRSRVARESVTGKFVRLDPEGQQIVEDASSKEYLRVSSMDQEEALGILAQEKAVVVSAAEGQLARMKRARESLG